MVDDRLGNKLGVFWVDCAFSRIDSISALLGVCEYESVSNCDNCVILTQRTHCG